MSKSFFALHWYWQAEDGRLYSTLARGLVAEDDPTFVAWSTGGAEPYPWPSDAEGRQTDASLQPALTPYGIFVTLDAQKAALKTRVDARAEDLRLTLITPGSGQAMEYQEAYAEAVQVDAALKANVGAALDPAAFPMLAASIGYDRDPTTGRPTADIPGEARSVLYAYDAYQKAGAAIRAARLKGKAAIDATAAAEAADAAFAAVAWPQLG